MHRIAVEIHLKRFNIAVGVHRQMSENNVAARLKVKKNEEKLHLRMLASVKEDRPAVQEIEHEA